MQMHTEENENFSISEDVSIAGTSAEQQSQSLAKPKCKRPRIQVRPNMSCGVNVSVNKIYYFFTYLSYIRIFSKQRPILLRLPLPRVLT